MNEDNHPKPTKKLKREALRSLTRLLIGGGISGAEALIRQMRTWEAELERLRTALPNPRDEEEAFEFSQPPAEETTMVLLRYAFIGWLIESQDRTVRRAQQINKITLGLWRIAEPWVRPLKKPLSSSRTLRVLRQRYAGFRARGEDELDRWIALGRQEELRSRDLANLALKRTVDQNIAYLAHNPELEQLVETQSTGLANEVVEEVRERTVSADTFLEGLARSLLRKAPRSDLPEPSESVRKLAEGRHPAKASSRRKRP